MVLQLDPRYPLVWRNPSSLQLGVDHPRVVLTDVSSTQERLIAALIAGISRPGLDMVAANAGATPAETGRLLAAVRPAMRPAPVAAPAGTVTVAGQGPTAERIADSLAASGLTPRFAGLDPDGIVDAAAEGELAVIVAQFVVAPSLHGVWLRRDIPHLPVVLGDTGARIGPMVEPGTGPCLWCLELHHTDIDPAWPAIASQLLGRRSPADAGLVAGEAAATATRMLLARVASGRPAPVAQSVEIDAASGARSPAAWAQHPECGCASLPGSARVGGPPNASAPPRRTTGAGALAPA